MQEQFNSNLKDFVEQELTKLGYKYVETSDLHRNFSVLSNCLRRVPIARKRKIIEAKSFQCPPQHKFNYARFVNTSEVGGSLLPFCSRGNRKRTHKVNDPLFNDWGIIHFHFKESGTKEIMFGLVESDTIYLLSVSGHGDVWHNKELIETIHRDFPHLIRHLKVGTGSESTTDIQHKSARTDSVNLPIVVNDGTSYYPTGIGVMTNKVSTHYILDGSFEKN